MARRNSRYATSRDIAEIGRLLRDLEGQFGHLAQSVAVDARQASSTVPDMISQALSDIAERVRATVQYSARSVGEEATRVGSGAWRKIEDEVVHRPLAALAIAAGIGFLIGALNRR